MSKLAELLKRLGAEADLAIAYEENPQEVMEEAGLSEKEKKLLTKGDLKQLEEATGLGPLNKINIIVKAYDK